MFVLISLKGRTSGPGADGFRISIGFQTTLTRLMLPQIPLLDVGSRGTFPPLLDVGL
jgi:hypothetical protein